MTNNSNNNNNNKTIWETQVQILIAWNLEKNQDLSTLPKSAYKIPVLLTVDLT